MGIRDAIAKYLLDSEPVRRRISEAYRAGFMEAYAGDDEPPWTMNLPRGYRRVGDVARDVGAATQDEAIELCYRQWQKNPVAQRIIEIRTNFVTGEGMYPDCEHPDVQAVCDEFWRINRCDERLEARVRELSLFGEQLYEAFVNEADGTVRIGAIDPAQIERVITDAENIERKIAVELKPIQGRKRVLRLIDLQEEQPSGSDWAGPLEGLAVREVVRGTGSDQRLCYEAELFAGEGDGIAFFFCVNDISTGTRGRPDLLPLLDWLDKYDQLLFDLSERAALISAFVYDVTLVGAEETMVRKRAADLAQAGAPKPGSVIVHNDRETWEAKTPNLGAQDMAQLAHVMRVHLAGGAGLPESWLGEGSTTNRATLLGQNVPTLKALAARQRYVKHMFETMLRFAVMQKVRCGLLPRELPVLDDEGNPTGQMKEAVEMVRVAVPDLDVKDMHVASQALAQASAALIGLSNMGMITREVAMRVLAQIIAQFGVEMDVQEALEELSGEQEPAYQQVPPSAVAQKAAALEALAERG